MATVKVGYARVTQRHVVPSCISRALVRAGCFRSKAHAFVETRKRLDLFTAFIGLQVKSMNNIFLILNNFASEKLSSGAFTYHIGCATYFFINTLYKSLN